MSDSSIRITRKITWFLNLFPFSGGTVWRYLLSWICRKNYSFAVSNSVTETYSFCWTQLIHTSLPLGLRVGTDLLSEILHFVWNTKQWMKSRNQIMLNGWRSWQTIWYSAFIYVLCTMHYAVFHKYISYLWWASDVILEVCINFPFMFINYHVEYRTQGFVLCPLISSNR